MRAAISVLVCLLSASVLAQTPDYSAAGRYGTAYRTEDIPGTTETMSGCRVYYPDSGGQLPQSAVPAPIVAFGHGWLLGINLYLSYAEHLASWGYVVVLPTYSNPIINPEHDKRARLMADAARWVAARDTVSGDVFFDRLDRWNWGFVGHSMGGSISMLAADTLRMPDTLRAVAALASPQSSPATHSEHLIAPKMILAGGTDNIAPWQDVRASFWDRAPAPGTFAVISGASHIDFLDVGYFSETEPPGTLGRETTQLVTRRHLTAFFERYLHGDRSAWNYAYVFGDSIVHHPTMDSVEVRPDPVAVSEGRKPQATCFKPGRTIVRGSLRLAQSASTSSSPSWLLDVAGRKVMELQAGENDVTRLAPGVYFVCPSPVVVRNASSMKRATKVVVAR